MGKTYELGFLITPLLPEEKAAALVEKSIKGFITKEGGVIKSETAPKMIPLAYPVRKVVEHKGSVFNEAYFGALRFELSSEGVVALRAELKKSLDLIRTLIITLPKDYNKIPERRIPPTRVAPTESGDGESKLEDRPAMTDEAIDKEIDSLLTPTS